MVFVFAPFLADATSGQAAVLGLYPINTRRNAPTGWHVVYKRILFVMVFCSKERSMYVVLCIHKCDLCACTNEMHHHTQCHPEDGQHCSTKWWRHMANETDTIQSFLCERSECPLINRNEQNVLFFHLQGTQKLDLFLDKWTELVNIKRVLVSLKDGELDTSQGRTFHNCF
jgi:hypothetical protein